MRFLPFVAAALAVVPGALAVDQKKSAIVWFEDESTPDNIVDECKNALIKAGGKITHVYSIIKCASSAFWHYDSSILTS